MVESYLNILEKKKPAYLILNALLGQRNLTRKEIYERSKKNKELDLFVDLNYILKNLSILINDKNTIKSAEFIYSVNRVYKIDFKKNTFIDFVIKNSKELKFNCLINNNELEKEYFKLVSEEDRKVVLSSYFSKFRKMYNTFSCKPNSTYCGVFDFLLENKFLLDAGKKKIFRFKILEDERSFEEIPSFEINYKELIKLFYEYIEKNLLEIIRNYSLISETVETDVSYKNLLRKEFKEKILINEDLISIFKEISKSYRFYSLKENSLETYFNNIIIHLSYLYHLIIMYKEKSFHYNSDFHLFVSIVSYSQANILPYIVKNVEDSVPSEIKNYQFYDHKNKEK